MKVVELFSGIGSQVKALKKIGKVMNVDVEILKTCEWDIHAMVAYNSINNENNQTDKADREEMLKFLSKYNLSYDGKKAMSPKQLEKLNLDTLSNVYDSIINNNNLVDIEQVKGSDIPHETDLLTYSFPCQDLSNVGSFHGYNKGIDRNKKTRSGLLWQIERILDEKYLNNEKLPRYLLLENVPSLLSKRHRSNFQEWISKLESIGYFNKIYILNALDFGIPQHRARVIMISIQVNRNIQMKNALEDYFKKNDLSKQETIKSFSFLKKKTLINLLKLDYNNKTLFNEALSCQPNNTPSRVKIWEQNYKIIDEKKKILDKVQTITTKQDRHPNSGNIYFKYNIDKNKSMFRFLTPRECLLLMGFEDEDYEKLIKNNFKVNRRADFFSRDVIFKLAGNSIVVNLLEAVFYQIFEIDKIFFKYNALLERK